MFRVLVLLGIFVFSAFGFSEKSFGESFTVQRVRYCTGGLLYDNKCTRAETSQNFKQWDAHNIKGSRKKMTYISIVSEPDIAKVEHLVFISAGQQVEVAINPDGYQNVLTGQPADYKKNCLGKTKTCVRDFDQQGLAMRLKNSGLYDMNKTLFVMVLDSQYNYYLSNKDEMLEAYWEFLTSKFYPGTLKDIVLAGQSRGGCLSLRLAERFRKRAAYKDIPLVLQLNDAVCRNNGAEVPGVSIGKTFANNPLNPNKMKSVLLAIDRVFPNAVRTNLFINNIHAGGKVGGLPIYAFTLEPENVDLGWWRQTWVRYAHTDLGGNFDNQIDTVLPAYKHILRALHKIRYGRFLQIAVAPVDFDGDGQSDIAMFDDGIARIGTQNQLSDLKLKVRLANGDGSFREHNSNILAENANLHFHPITPFLPGYFSNDRKTDIVNLAYVNGHGLQIRTYASRGDGTFSAKNYISGDGRAYEKFPVLVGDVDGDGLSDLLLFYRSAQNGLMVRTKFSKGDGQFRATEFKLGDGSAVDILPVLAADINGDNKTDIVLQYQDGNGHKIRTKISNGDGTFTEHEFATGEWLAWGEDRFLIGDINRDRKSDLVRVFYDKNDGLRVHTFLSRGDGRFDVKRQKIGGSKPGYTFPATLADVNGDRRDDIVLRHRDGSGALVVETLISSGDGQYQKSTTDLGTDGRMDANPILVGTYNRDGRKDLGFHSVIKDANMVVRARDTIWSYAGQPDGEVRRMAPKQTASETSTLGIDSYPALSGPLGWRAQGGTFPPCRPPVCALAPAKPGSPKPRLPGLKPIPGAGPKPFNPDVYKGPIKMPQKQKQRIQKGGPTPLIDQKKVLPKSKAQHMEQKPQNR